MNIGVGYTLALAAFCSVIGRILSGRFLGTKPTASMLVLIITADGIMSRRNAIILGLDKVYIKGRFT